jgi:hypothetical protein
MGWSHLVTMIVLCKIWAFILYQVLHATNQKYSLYVACIHLAKAIDYWQMAIAVQLYYCMRGGCRFNIPCSSQGISNDLNNCVGLKNNYLWVFHPVAHKSMDPPKWYDMCVCKYVNNRTGKYSVKRNTYLYYIFTQQ